MPKEHTVCSRKKDLPLQGMTPLVLSFYILWKQTVCQLQKCSLRRESGSKACTEQPGKDSSIGL